MLELLAPGGSLEGLKAAVNAGADAVYMGGQRFGARAYAQNPEEAELFEALDYCHLRGKKLYLTVNTLLKEQELERELYDYLAPLYEHGVDAVLVQDFGVFQFIRRNFPDLPLHASTQMTITGVDGAKLLKSMGAERIVPARELTLEEIREIHRQVDLEIECFVHGALCYSYSGQCLMSSILGGRSGNRGRCAQPCRLPYSLYKEIEGEGNPEAFRERLKDGKRSGKAIQRLNGKDQQYLLSLKDICTLRSLPKLTEAGVCSFKIEGRMKRPEYAAGVTEIYRKYLDLYQEGKEDYRVLREDEQALMDLYNRGGFSQGYYETYNGKVMMSMERPNHQGTEAAAVLEVKRGSVRLKALEPLFEKDVVEPYISLRSGSKSTGERALLQKKTEDTVRKMETAVKLPVPRGREFSLSGSFPAVKPGQIFLRVRSERQLERLRENYVLSSGQEKIKGKFILKKESRAILQVWKKDCQVTVTGEEALEAKTRPLDSETVARQLKKTGNTPFVFQELVIDLEEQLFYSMQGLNELRRRALEELEERWLAQFRRSLSTGMGETAGEAADPAPKQAGEKEEAADPASEQFGEKIFGKVGEDIRSGTDIPMLRASAETWEQAETLITLKEIQGIYLDSYLFLGQKENRFEELASRIRETGKKCFLMLPLIWRENGKKAFEKAFPERLLDLADGFLLRSSEQLEYFKDFAGKKEMIADSGIYTYNREARAFLKQRGITIDTVPLECNSRELNRRGCQGSECIVYGRIPLMVTAQCLQKNLSGCQRRPGILWLEDRKKAVFPVRNQCSCCTNVLYNSLPLDLVSCGEEVLTLRPASCRLSFTFEEEALVRQVVQAAADCFQKGMGQRKAVPEGTKGHFKRGVE